MRQVQRIIARNISQKNFKNRPDNIVAFTVDELDNGGAQARNQDLLQTDRNQSRTQHREQHLKS